MINWRIINDETKPNKKLFMLLKNGCIVHSYSTENKKFLNCNPVESSTYLNNVKKWCYESDLIKDAENDVCEYSYNYSQDRFEYSCGLVLPKVIGNPDYCSNCGKWLKRKCD